MPSSEADAQCDFYAMATTESFLFASKAMSAQKNLGGVGGILLLCVQCGFSGTRTIDRTQK